MLERRTSFGQFLCRAVHNGAAVTVSLTHPARAESETAGDDDQVKRSGRVAARLRRTRLVSISIPLSPIAVCSQKQIGTLKDVTLTTDGMRIVQFGLKIFF